MSLSTWPSRALLAVAFALGCVGRSDAQGVTPDHAAEWVGKAPVWAGELAFLGINSLLGGLTAGVAREIRGGSFQDGFARGALGGAISYGGRRISVESFTGAGFLGGQVSAVGASVVRNASEDRPSFERLFFPLGPLHLYLDRRSEARLHAKLDLATTAVALWAATRPELRFDPGKSFSAGTPVFEAPGRRIRLDEQDANGFVWGSVIIIGGILGPNGSRTFPHERVHVLQGDFTAHTRSDPVEEWLARKSRPTSWLIRYVDLGVTADLLRWKLYEALDVDWGERPHEIEAEFLERR